MSDLSVRLLRADRPQEVELVAQRMRETLIEVLGADRGAAMYTMPWLIHRVRQHLPGGDLEGAVFVAEEGNTVVAHAIVRVDADDAGHPLGLFSTVFVAPHSRRRGVAGALLERGETWMLERGLSRARTYTDPGNQKLKELFLRRGYRLEPMSDEFVALTRSLCREAVSS